MKQVKNNNLARALRLRALAKTIEPISNTRHGNQLIAFRALRNLQGKTTNLLSFKRWIRTRNWKRNNKLLKNLVCIASRKLDTQTKQKQLSTYRTHLKSTRAWQSSEKEINERKWNFRGRVSNVENLISQMIRKDSQKIFFFHHFDEYGYIPKSWLTCLEKLDQNGWMVIVSSTFLNEKSQEEILERNLLLSKRKNMGLCLGAYKDFILMIKDKGSIANNCNQLILANDSTIPIKGSDAFASCIDDISKRLHTEEALMAGITDSVQCGTYHIQSYLLGVNQALIKNSTWTNFWQELSLTGDKETLIREGELTLSNKLVEAGLTTWARYPLINLLIDQENIEHELGSQGILMPSLCNPTIHAWKSLLNAGCPLIKKQLIFEIAQQPIPISQIGQWMNDNEYEIRADLEHLLRSRFKVIHNISNSSKPSLPRRIINRLKRIINVSIGR